MKTAAYFKAPARGWTGGGGGGKGCLTQRDPDPVQETKMLIFLPSLRESAVIFYPVQDWTKHTAAHLFAFHTSQRTHTKISEKYVQAERTPWKWYPVGRNVPDRNTWEYSPSPTHMAWTQPRLIEKTYSASVLARVLEVALEYRSGDPPSWPALVSHVSGDGTRERKPGYITFKSAKETRQNINTGDKHELHRRRAVDSSECLPGTWIVEVVM